jgi:hypothetical protein
LAVQAPFFALSAGVLTPVDLASQRKTSAALDIPLFVQISDTRRP